jgi:serine protease Do
MLTRKGILAMVLSSMLGGIFALVLYVGLVPRPVAYVNNGASASLTNYVFDSTDFVVPEGLNFVFAAKAATPSVVHIRTTYSAGRTGGTPFEDFFRDYFGERYPNQNPSRGAGSGVIVSENGYIITNNHVIEDATEITVLLNDNRTYQAEVVGTDPSTDLAVIRINETNLRAIPLGNSETIEIGEWVLAIGSPFEFRSTVTAGIVSAKARNINILARRDRLQIESFIQTDAAVNPGNSGGALVNLKGELVGVNTAIASPTGAFAGYSFAVPVSLVKKVAADLMEFGTVQRPLLGVSIVDVNADIAKDKNLEKVQGVYLQFVNPGSSAEEAGLKAGDVIIAIEGKIVGSVAELQERVALNRPGDRIKVTYVRDGKTKEAFAMLQNAYGTTSVVEMSNVFRRDGATFEQVNDALKTSLKIKGGVQVKEIENGRWRAAGIKKGFVITKVDKQDVISLEQFITVLNNFRGDGLLIEGYYPGGEKAYYGIGW